MNTGTHSVEAIFNQLILVMVPGVGGGHNLEKKLGHSYRYNWIFNKIDKFYEYEYK